MAPFIAVSRVRAPFLVSGGEALRLLHAPRSVVLRAAACRWCLLLEPLGELWWCFGGVTRLNLGCRLALPAHSAASCVPVTPGSDKRGQTRNVCLPPKALRQRLRFFSKLVESAEFLSRRAETLRWLAMQSEILFSRYHWWNPHLLEEGGHEFPRYLHHVHACAFLCLVQGHGDLRPDQWGQETAEAFSFGKVFKFIEKSISNKILARHSTFLCVFLLSKNHCSKIYLIGLDTCTRIYCSEFLNWFWTWISKW